MGKFVVLDSPHAVSKFWHDVQTRIATRKEPAMPLTKSLSDVAWQAVSAAAQALVDAKTFRTTAEAIDAMKASSHPAYLTYLASLSSGSTPPAPGDVTKVVKAAETQALAKRQAVQAEVTKRAAPLMRAGLAKDEATRQVLNGDRDLYRRWQQSGYASGPLPPVAHEGNVVPTGPVQAEVSRLAKALKTDDLYGRFATASEPELVEEVFKRHPALYWAHRAEVLR